MIHFLTVSAFYFPLFTHLIADEYEQVSAGECNTSKTKAQIKKILSLPGNLTLLWTTTTEYIKFQYFLSWCCLLKINNHAPWWPSVSDRVPACIQRSASRWTCAQRWWRLSLQMGHRRRSTRLVGRPLAAGQDADGAERQRDVHQ